MEWKAKRHQKVVAEGLKKQSQLLAILAFDSKERQTLQFRNCQGEYIPVNSSGF